MLHSVRHDVYKVVLTHEPTAGSAVAWTVKVYAPSLQDEPVYTSFGSSREHAFDKATDYIKAAQERPEPASTVWVNAKGEILGAEER